MLRHTYIIVLLLVIFITIPSAAQPPIRIRVAPQVDPDSTDLAYYGKRHFWQAAATVTGLNVGVWAFDRFIQHGDFAYINFHTIGENFRHGFIWDNDRLGTNMFLHPYHGSLYYNGARSNGFNYWQSGLFAFYGSSMWELFMEREYPSTNDVIATPIGGMAIGEVAYRASDVVLKDNTTGWERFGREAAAFLLAPTRGLTRIINGDAWRKRPTTGRQFGIPNVAIEFSGGVRFLEFKEKVIDSGVGLTTEFNVEYGDRFEVASTKPYDYFTVRAALNLQRGQPALGKLNIMGRLIARELLEDYTYGLSVGMYQHFDYYDSDTISDVSDKTPYKLGVPACVGAGAMFRDVERGHWTFDAYVHGNAVILGAILSDYYNVDERNYNLGSGFSVKTGFNWVFNRDKFSFSASYEYYRLFTWKGYPRNMNWHDYDYRTLNAQGDRSVAFLGIVDVRLDYRLHHRWYLTATFSQFHRSTHYRDFPHVGSSTLSTRLMLTYKL